MMPTSRECDSYHADFEKLDGELSGRGPAWLGLLRKAALERFAELKFPTQQDEEWKHTSVAPLAKVPFRAASPYRGNGRIGDKLQDVTFGELECTHLVFVNGHYAPDLSRLRPLPEGVKVGSLAGFLREEPGLLEPHLARHARFENQAFIALNTAFLRDGAFVFLPKRKVLDEPIHLLFVSTSGGEAVVSHPRNLIVAGAAADLEPALTVEALIKSTLVPDALDAETAPALAASATAQPQTSAPAAAPVPLEFEGLKFPNDGVLTRQWMDFLSQMSTTK